MKNIYIASLEEGEGKTVAGLSIALKYGNAGYMKPVGDNPAYLNKRIVDYDALLFAKLFGMDATLLSLGMHYSKIMYNYEDVMKEIERRYESISDGKNVFIFEGGEKIWKGESIAGMKKICEKFGAKPVFIIGGDEYEIPDKIKFISLIEKEAAIIVNRHKKDFKTEIEENGMEFGGHIPEIKKLRLTKVRYIVERLNGKVVAGEDGLEKYFEEGFIAALSGNQIKRHPDFKKRNKLIITGGDRSDAITACIEENTSAIILTNNIIPSSNILAKADKAEIPIISVRQDTYTIARRVEKIPRVLMADENEKIQEIKRKAKVEI